MNEDEPLTTEALVVPPKKRTRRKRSPDIVALTYARRALTRSTNRQTLEANLRFLWDHFVAHPSPTLPEHLVE